MDKMQALDIMNSDFKLWEAATETPIAQGVVEKTIDLPWGIGPVTVRMEGMNDAAKRREAVGAYGEYIRNLIDDRINDESVTARAKAAAAKTEPVDSEDGDGVGGPERVRGGAGEAEVPQAANEEADRVHEQAAEGALSFRETLVARRVEVDGRIGRLTAELDTACRDLAGIDAALKAMDEDVT